MFDSVYYHQREEDFIAKIFDMVKDAFLEEMDF